jgi:hypothetical protein
MDLEEKVYCLTHPTDINDIVAIGVSLDFTQDIVGLYLGFKKVVAPSIFFADISKTYGAASFIHLGSGFDTGLVTNMRVPNPSFLMPLSEDYPDYQHIQRELLHIRSERPKACLQFQYDSKKGYWVYDKFHPEVPLDSAYSTYDGE